MEHPRLPEDFAEFELEDFIAYLKAEDGGTMRQHRRDLDRYLRRRGRSKEEIAEWVTDVEAKFPAKKDFGFQDGSCWLYIKRFVKNGSRTGLQNVTLPTIYKARQDLVETYWGRVQDALVSANLSTTLVGREWENLIAHIKREERKLVNDESWYRIFAVLRWLWEIFPHRTQADSEAFRRYILTGTIKTNQVLAKMGLERPEIPLTVLPNLTRPQLPSHPYSTTSSSSVPVLPLATLTSQTTHDQQHRSVYEPTRRPPAPPPYSIEAPLPEYEEVLTRTPSYATVAPATRAQASASTRTNEPGPSSTSRPGGFRATVRRRFFGRHGDNELHSLGQSHRHLSARQLVVYGDGL
ncbi:uncharacterized protein JCM6883_005745 [Sporobolomyces salmoneus]|uniref:uncharacterized protein n=1 Tax=Sporobolomyces salmoneus TaxID=183962 RepID=UPI0031725F33